MTLKRVFYSFIILLSMTVVSCISKKGTAENINFTQFVDPFIGTGDHGHVFLGANVPFGAVQLGPTQMSQGWDWCSGYNWRDSTIRGFSHLHLSGTGIGDLGDITFMPVCGNTPINPGIIKTPKIPKDLPTGYESGFYSEYSHDKESACPGYYAVHLDRYNIDVELTATARTGFHKYTYPKNEEAKIIIDLVHGIGWDAPLECSLQHPDATHIAGSRISKGWANHQEVFFHAEFSKPVVSIEYYDGQGNAITNGDACKRGMYGVVSFGKSDGKPLLAKVGISPVSISNASLNLNTELKGWDFDKCADEANAAWNKELSKIDITTSDVDHKTIFYTSLFHTMVAPSLFCDVNGDYRAADGKTYKNASFTNYTTFSLWDTYRAAHPLMTIIHPEKLKDIALTMLDIYDKQGKLPVWHLVGNETNCMVGNPGISALADIVLKYPGIDIQRAYRAMVNSAQLDERGMDLLKQYGYIPFDKYDDKESVAKTMEYAIADRSIAQVAGKAGDDAGYEKFIRRSEAYKYFFDPKTRFMRALDSKGHFREPFNPFKSIHRQDDYTEGNAWQYTWLVPQDVHGLISLFGGDAPFIEKLDSLFIVEGDLGEGASADITGLIGQYAHGNEPSHHIIYMYAYAGQQWKTAGKAREILTTLYRNSPAGLCGNEDVGQMSAWFIMSSLGMYQVIPAGGIYVLGSPLFDIATIHVGNNITFTVKATGNGKDAKYIQSAKLNGSNYTKSYITHADIMAGGTLELVMGTEPSDFGTDPADRP